MVNLVSPLFLAFLNIFLKTSVSFSANACSLIHVSISHPSFSSLHSKNVVDGVSCSSSPSSSEVSASISILGGCVSGASSSLGAGLLALSVLLVVGASLCSSSSIGSSSTAGFAASRDSGCFACSSPLPPSLLLVDTGLIVICLGLMLSKTGSGSTP